LLGRKLEAIVGSNHDRLLLAIEQSKMEVDQLGRQLEQASNELDQLRRSKSWRVTGPLRLVYGWMLKLR
jgi:hypothetical protein